MKPEFQADFREGILKRLEAIKGSRSIADMARNLCISHPRLSSYFRGEKIPSAETLYLIARKEKVNLNWLITGDGDMLIPEGWYETQADFYKEGSNVFEETARYYKDHKPIPVVGTASANPDATIEWEALEHETTDLGAAVAIRVKDDSMEPLARSGQFVIAVPDAELHSGDLAVIHVRRRGVFFKRIFFHQDDTLELQSANPLKPQPSLTIRLKDILKRYRVIGVKFE